MHTTGDFPHLLADTTYCTRTPQAACTQLEHSQGGAEKAEMLQNDYLQEICLPRLHGHTGQTDPIHLYLAGKLQHDWNDHMSFPRMHRTPPGLPQVCYTGPGLLYWMCRSLSNLQNLSLSLFFFSFKTNAFCRWQ